MMRYVLAALAALFVSPAQAAIESPLPDLVCETTASTGTGLSITLAGAAVGYLGFSSQVVSGNQVYYNIVTGSGASRKVETGLGTWTSPTTFLRAPAWSTDGVATALNLAGTSTVCAGISGDYLALGAGSGLNADLLDGISSGGFQSLNANLTALTTVFTAASAAGPSSLEHREDTDNGTNFLRIAAPSAVTTNQTCTLEDDASFIPDSCVGDGTDATGGLPADPGTNSVLGWDDTANGAEWWNPGTGLTASTSTIDCDASTETAVGCIELATTAEVETGTDTTRASTAAGVLAAGTGKELIPVMAAAMKSNATSGASCGDVYDSGSNDLSMFVCAFDSGATEERTDFQVPMPKRWNEGTFTFQAMVTCVSCTVSQTIQFELSCVALSHDDTLNATMGTAVTSAVTVTAATNDLLTSTESSAMTCAGTPQENDLVAFRVSRDTSVDNATGDALLIAVKLYWTSNALTDD